MTNPTRPILLLDVDGVLNKVGKRNSDPEGFNDFRMARCNGFPIWYSPEMGRRIAALDVDAIWLTTWEMDDLANEWISPLYGWEPLPVIVRQGHDAWRGWWKSTAAQETVEAFGRPFIWLDDDLYFSVNQGDVPWLESCTLPNLCISPAGDRALLPRHLDQIEEWIEGLKK